MSLQAVKPAIGDLIRPRSTKRQVVLRYNWIMSVTECGRAYFARINQSLILNVHRRPRARVWEYVVIGYDLTKPDAPLMLDTGTRATMAEAKEAAEQRVPAASPDYQTEIPF